MTEREKKRLLDRAAKLTPRPALLPSERWRCQFYVNGKRNSVTADTPEEAHAQAVALRAGLLQESADRAEQKKGNLTLADAIDLFIQRRENVLSPSTINAYKSYRKTRFKGYMDEDVEQINYQRMVNDECKKVTAKTVHNAYRLVTASLKHANIPITPVNLPQKHKTERPWLDYQQISILLDKCKGKPYELGILLGLHGLRRSEILHLTSDDIDTERGLIYVRGASVIGENNKLTDKATNKTTASSRTVNIVIPRLNDVVKGKTGRLITTNPTTMYALINKLCEKNGLPQVGVHGLRHSFASLAYHLGWSELTTMREGGWSNPDTVHRIYTHLAAQDANADIQRMKDFYS